MNRETIYSALFAKLSAVPGFSTYSRRLRLWTDVPAAKRPALYLAQRDNEYRRDGEHVPQKTTLHAEIFIYTAAGQDPNATPASELNTLLDAIDTALAPEPVTGRQTLGGLVSHCWIEGNIILDPGDLDGDGMAIIPVRMLVP